MVFLVFGVCKYGDGECVGVGWSVDGDSIKGWEVEVISVIDLNCLSFVKEFIYVVVYWSVWGNESLGCY